MSGRPIRPDRNDLAFHNNDYVESRNPNKIRHLRDFRRSLIYHPRRLVEAELIRGCNGRRGSGESSGEGVVEPWARPVPAILVATRPEQVEPVARSTHLDPAPRGAVWKVGPRPDLIRSARTNEPGGMAIRPGDQD